MAHRIPALRLMASHLFESANALEFVEDRVNQSLEKLGGHKSGTDSPMILSMPIVPEGQLGEGEGMESPPGFSERVSELSPSSRTI